MKSMTMALLVSFVVFSGVSLAAQSEGRKDRSSMMQGMMKDGQPGEHKGGMMRMMKMMDQCAAMMESAHEAEEIKESPKQ